MNLILAAVPFFFLLIAIEIITDWYRKTGYYRLNDAISSLSLGVLSRVNGVARKFIPFTIYYLAFDHVAQFALPNETWVWLLAFVLYDFCYYWKHRLSHEINLLWAAHVVHHSSEEYNLTTALRQTSGDLFDWVFYLPLAILGIPPEILIAVGSINLIYQFWVHTRHIGKLGWYEWIFVTPSNHRVHHAQNDVYIDRNYGGVFILWDRWFGTFQEELDNEPVIYGIRKPLSSWNPVWANFQVYWRLISDAWYTARWQDKFAIWFKPTGWRPADVEKCRPLAKSNLQKFKKFDIPLGKSISWYCVLQHLLVIALALLMMHLQSSFSLLTLVGLLSLLVLANVSLSWVMEQRWNGYLLEWVKLSAVLVFIQAIQVPEWLYWSFAGTSVTSMVWLLLLHRQTSLKAA